MKKIAFDVNRHINPNLLEIYHKKKVSKKGLLNLSSNELLHEKLLEFNKIILSDIELSSFSSYRFFYDDIEKASSYFGLTPNEMTLSSGSDNAIKIITEAIIKNTGRLLIPVPNYENYFSYSQLRNINISTIPFDKIANTPKHTVFDITKLLVSTLPSVLVISNPNGFTGEMFSFQDMSDICRLAEEYGHLVIVDEAYSEFGRIDHVNLLKTYNNVIIIKSFSKAFGLAGLRIAAIFSSPTIIEYINKWNVANDISGFTLEIFKKYLDNHSFISQIQNEIITCRDWIISEIQSNYKNINTNNSKANFVLLDLENLEKATEFEEYLKKHHIIIRNLGHINGLEGFIRMTVGQKKIMEPILSLIQDF